MNWTAPVQDKTDACYCGNEPSGFIKCREILD